MNTAAQQAICIIVYPFTADRYLAAAETVRHFDARGGAELELIATLAGTLCEASHLGTYEELRDHGYSNFGPSS